MARVSINYAFKKKGFFCMSKKNASRNVVPAVKKAGLGKAKALAVSKKLPAVKKAVAKPNASAKNDNLSSLDRKAVELEAEVLKSRKAILDNELVLRRKISEKISAEDQLGALLRKKFSDEQALLSRVKAEASRKQSDLKQKISSLERISRIYVEKKARIKNAKKRHSSLKRQLELLEKQAGDLGAYA